MRYLGDITMIHGDEIEAVDVITGGSPCQDLSVAGKRAGLAGERSGLFMEQVRIVKEMRERDRRNGRSGRSVRPRYMVWENVTGAFSSNGGKDFQAVLTEIVRIAEPEAPDVPLPDKGWPDFGLLMGNGWSVSWRVHDAQYWGVPQRRKRIALVADFGGHSAGEVQTLAESLSGNPAESGEKRKSSAAGAEGSAGATGGGECGDGSRLGLIDTVGGQSESCEITETALPILAIEGNGQRPSHKGDGFSVSETMYTLNATEQHGVAYTKKAFGISGYTSNAMLSDNPNSGIYEADTSRTLDLNGGNPACNQGGIVIVEKGKDEMGKVIGIDHVLMSGGTTFQGRGWYDNVSGCLKTQAHGVLTYEKNDDPEDVSAAEKTSYTLQIRGGCDGGGKGALIQTEKSATLGTSQTQTLIQIQKSYQETTGSLMASGYSKLGTQEAMNDMFVVERRPDEAGDDSGSTAYTAEAMFCFEPRSKDGVPRVHGAVCPTLNTAQGGQRTPCIVSKVIGIDHANDYTAVVVEPKCWDGGDIAPTLTANNAGGNQRMPDKENFNCVLVPETANVITKGFAMQAFGEYADTDVGSACKSRDYKDATDLVVSAVNCRNLRETEMSGTLQAKENGGQSLNYQNPVRVSSIVRRLTPTECERLQGFPDGWSETGIMPDGTEKKMSDSTRYRLQGNSIALPYWKWMLRRIAGQYERTATLGSLFDGQGGFPVCWAEVNGPESCRWSSEIDQNAEAVVRKHFGDEDRGIEGDFWDAKKRQYKL